MFKLEISMANAAFEGRAYDELVSILRGVADRLERETVAVGFCRDTNGNKVGEWSVSPNDGGASC